MPQDALSLCMHRNAMLHDLDAAGPQGGGVHTGDEMWCSGERVGTLRDGQSVVLVWEK
jgi:hypothetical protein